MSRKTSEGPMVICLCTKGDMLKCEQLDKARKIDTDNELVRGREPQKSDAFDENIL